MVAFFFLPNLMKVWGCNMTEKRCLLCFIVFFPSVLLWIESMTLSYYYSVQTVVLFQLERSLAILSELTVSLLFFFFFSFCLFSFFFFPFLQKDCL